MAGNFKLLTLIGTGTFGEAWVARSLSDDKKCVVKVIKILKLSEKELDQSLTEVSILARMNHPNIIQYLDAYVDDGSLNIAMEYAAGGDLHKKISSQKGIHFGREVILDWFVQICLALQYIHAKNILHRDLKSQNIFLTTQNMIKIGDFGIARVLRDSADHAQTTIGTPFYLSPEICQKKPYNHKSDMWALGCVLYELCCLRVPFDAPDFQGLVQKILQEKYDSIPRHLGSTLAFLVTKLLDKDPDKRPSAGTVLAMSSLKVHVQRNQKKTKSGLTQRRKSGSQDNVKGQKSAVKKRSESSDKDGGKPEKKSYCCIDKENIDPGEVGRTYIVKNPKFRHLSMATPKISRVVARQKQSHSSESEAAVVESQENPRMLSSNKPKRTVSEPRPQVPVSIPKENSIRDKAVHPQRPTARPRIISEPQPTKMRNKPENYPGSVHKQETCKAYIDTQKPPSGKGETEAFTAMKEKKRLSSYGRGTSQESIDGALKRKSLEPKQKRTERRSNIPRRKSLEPRPQPVGSENVVILQKCANKEDSSSSSQLQDSTVNLSTDYEEVFYPAEQAIPLWLDSPTAENHIVYEDQNDNQLDICVYDGKKRKLQFGPQKKEIDRVMRRSSSYDTVIMAKKKDEKNESQIQRALSTGNIEDCREKNDEKNRVKSTTYSIKKTAMTSSSVTSGAVSNEKYGNEAYGATDFISRTIYNSMMDTYCKSSSALDYIQKNLLHVFCVEHLEQITEALQNILKKEEGFYKVKELLTENDQIYLPLVLHYIHLHSC